MKPIIHIICTVLVCCTAFYIYISFKESNRYYYNVGTGGAIKIDRYNGDVFSNAGKGWVNIDDKEVIKNPYHRELLKLKKKFFNLFIVDHNRGLFNVIENLSDDNFHNDLIVKAQETGRDIRAFASENTDPLTKTIRSYENQMGYKYTKDNVLIH